MQMDVDTSARFLGAHHDILVGLTRVSLLARLGADMPEEQRERLCKGLVAIGRSGIVEHHGDEEAVLFTEMIAAAAPGDELELVEALTNRLSREHRALEALWAQLEPSLAALEAGKNALIPVAIAQKLADLYQAHTQFEETVVLPLAEKMLSSSEKEALDLNLRLRHRVSNLPTYI